MVDGIKTGRAGMREINDITKDCVLCVHCVSGLNCNITLVRVNNVGSYEINSSQEYGWLTTMTSADNAITDYVSTASIDYCATTAGRNGDVLQEVISPAPLDEDPNTVCRQPIAHGNRVGLVLVADSSIANGYIACSKTIKSFDDDTGDCRGIGTSQDMTTQIESDIRASYGDKDTGSGSEIAFQSVYSRHGDGIGESVNLECLSLGNKLRICAHHQAERCYQ